MYELNKYIKLVPKALSLVTPFTPFVISNFFPYESDLRGILQPPVNTHETAFFTTVYFILCIFVLLYVYALRRERGYPITSALIMFALGLASLFFYYNTFTLPSRTLGYYGIDTAVTQYPDASENILVVCYYAIFFFFTWAFASLGTTKSDLYSSLW